MEPAVASVSVGDLVDGKYRIIRTIGEGGWGIVFEGENTRTFKRVAIKILRMHSAVTKDILLRFEREAQAAGRIGSDHIVEVYDLGQLPDGTHYMVMELLTGTELAARLRAGGPLDAVAVAKIVLQVLDGLKAAHEAGILHRDLKPENLFLVPTRSGEEFVKILDFGISKFNNVEKTSATMTGAVLGSPCYMAPEQARGLKQIDARTDLYAVGTLMYESLTGKVPFLGDNFNDLMFKIVLAPRPDPRELRPDLDPGMAALVMKAMAIEPRDRYQTTEALSQALLDWLAARGIASIRPPELKRAGTPRVSREPTPTPEPPRAPTPVEKATVREAGGSGGPGTPQWHEATMPAETGLGTPLVSSSSDVRVSRTPGAARKTPVAVLAAAAALAVVGVAGGVMFARGPSRPAAAGPADPPPVSAGTTTAVTTTTQSAATPPAATVPPAVSLAAPEETSATTAEAPSATGSAHRPPVSVGTSRAGGAPPPATTTRTAAPPASAAAAATTTKPVSTVEGREIRTGL
jgi:serine/threonine protein kinase